MKKQKENVEIYFMIHYIYIICVCCIIGLYEIMVNTHFFSHISDVLEPLQSYSGDDEVCSQGGNDEVCHAEQKEALTKSSGRPTCFRCKQAPSEWQHEMIVKLTVRGSEITLVHVTLAAMAGDK